MFVPLLSIIHRTRKFGTAAWTKQSAAESLPGHPRNERGTVSKL